MKRKKKEYQKNEVQRQYKKVRYEKNPEILREYQKRETKKDERM